MKINNINNADKTIVKRLDELLKMIESIKDEVASLKTLMAEPTPEVQSEQKLLTVTFHNDKIVIRERKAADTFANAIEKIGIERVRELGLSHGGISLVHDRKEHRYCQRQRGGWWICAHSSVDHKIQTLYRIADLLNISLSAERT